MPDCWFPPSCHPIICGWYNCVWLCAQQDHRTWWCKDCLFLFRFYVFGYLQNWVHAVCPVGVSYQLILYQFIGDTVYVAQTAKHWDYFFFYTVYFNFSMITLSFQEVWTEKLKKGRWSLWFYGASIKCLLQLI